MVSRHVQHVLTRGIRYKAGQQKVTVRMETRDLRSVERGRGGGLGHDYGSFIEAALSLHASLRATGVAHQRLNLLPISPTQSLLFPLNKGPP